MLFLPGAQTGWAAVAELREPLTALLRPPCSSPGTAPNSQRVLERVTLSGHIPTAPVTIHQGVPLEQILAEGPFPHQHPRVLSAVPNPVSLCPNHAVHHELVALSLPWQGQAVPQLWGHKDLQRNPREGFSCSSTLLSLL